jgi:3-hydroxybutyryl-CoA dehydrogenase
LIHGQAPSRAALKSVRNALAAIGITTVETTHALGGLLLDRQFIPALGEACKMLRSGEATIGALDQGFPIPWLMHLGPLQAADLLGIDHVIATARSLCTLTGNDRFSPDPLLEALEERGHLGWKNGRGFYNYALDD